jgi:hypothetical protein
VAWGFILKLLVSVAQEYRAHFDSFDTNHDGFVVPEELKGVLQNLNMYESMDQVHRLIDEVDKNKNGKVEFSEFLDIVANLKAGKTSNFTKVYSKQKELIQMKTATGTHTYAEEEMSAFAEHLNLCLQGDADCKHLLPIDPNGLDLCKKVSDGILLAKFMYVPHSTMDLAGLICDAMPMNCRFVRLVNVDACLCVRSFVCVQQRCREGYDRSSCAQQAQEQPSPPGVPDHGEPERRAQLGHGHPCQGAFRTVTAWSLTPCVSEDEMR